MSRSKAGPLGVADDNLHMTGQLIVVFHAFVSITILSRGVGERSRSSPAKVGPKAALAYDLGKSTP
jgi:hypothetical protein